MVARKSTSKTPVAFDAATRLAFAYNPVEGSNADKFLRSFSKLMRHQHSAQARATAREYFPHYIADVLDQYTTTIFPDEDPALHARDIHRLACLIPAIAIGKHEFSIAPEGLAEIYLDYRALTPGAFAATYKIERWAHYLEPDVEFGPILEPPPPRSPYDQLAAILAPADAARGRQLADTAILNALRRSQWVQHIDRFNTFAMALLALTALAAMLWPPAFLAYLSATALLALTAITAARLTHHDTDARLNEWVRKQGFPSLAHWSDTIWHPEKKRLHTKKRLGLTLCRRNPLSPTEYHAILAKELSRAPNTAATRKLVQVIEEQDDL